MRRATFGFFVLGYIIYWIPVFTASIALLSDPFASAGWAFAMWLPGAAVVMAAVVRRLHDRGRSAWWLGIFFGIPFALMIPEFVLSVAQHSGSISAGFFYAGVSAFIVVASIFMWWGFIEIAFLRGTVGENRFGPDPLGKSV
jgi:uncharacterized membrane protein YhaH (DUF805 family)